MTSDMNKMTLMILFPIIAQHRTGKPCDVDFALLNILAITITEYVDI